MSTQTQMKVKELSATFHLPTKLQPTFGADGKELAQQLPPCNPMPAFPVDMYPACPRTWMHGSDMASSYFVPVEEEKGLWIDFNECEKFGYDVAVVISVQGINPITGQKTDKLRLEQYKKKCPVHDVSFKQDRFCPKCGFKWPSQNYVTTTSTPEGYLWIDGFRNPNGTVRQYIFTEEEMKSIAGQLIGKDKVFAIGIAFYISKKKKETKSDDSDFNEMLKQVNSGDNAASYSPPAYMGHGSKTPFIGFVGGMTKGGSAGDVVHAQPMFFSPMHQPQNWKNSSSSSSSTSSGSASTRKGLNKRKGVVTSPSAKDLLRGASIGDANISCCVNNETMPMATSGMDMSLDGTLAEINELQVDSFEGDAVEILAAAAVSPAISPEDALVEETEVPEVIDASEVEEIDPVKNLEIAAGALIKQQIHEDPKKMDYWEPEPFGMIYVNYCDPETAKRILAQGRIKEKADGFMDGAKLATETTRKES